MSEYIPVIFLAVVALGGVLLYSIGRTPARPAAPEDTGAEPVPPAPAFDFEVEMVVTVAAWLAGGDGATDISTEHFVRAARANPAVAELLGPLEQTGASGPGNPPGDVKASPTLSLALAQAARRAADCGSRTIGLHHVLGALQASGGKAAEQLRGLDTERLEQRLAHPGPEPTPAVYMLNDQASRMESVVTLLEQHFRMDPALAHYQMLTIHHRGYALIARAGVERCQGMIEAATQAALELGCGHMKFAKEAPDTKDWERGDQGLLPPLTTGWSVSG